MTNGGVEGATGYTSVPVALGNSPIVIGRDPSIPETGTPIETETTETTGGHTKPNKTAKTPPGRCV